MKKTYVFPGQGSQIKGMGEHLFDKFPELTKKADKILGYSIKELCINDPGHQLSQTQYTQPAMYVVNALSFQEKVAKGEKQPDFLAGHSLGEYNALQAAGVISFEDGLKLVKKRGELMSKAKNGRMAAILNSSEEQIREILREAGLENIDIANLNSPAQIVISGLEEDINKAQPYFEKADTVFIPLNTSGAFHSRYMKDAEAEYVKFIKRAKFAEPGIPVIANVTAKPYVLENAGQHLIEQLSNCVRWSESINYLLSQGEMEFEELGVGDVLTKLIGAIKRGHGSTVKAAAEKSADTVQPREQPDPAKLVEQWNKTYPVGTRVVSEFYDTELETRTEAVLLFGHRAAIYMKGYNGYFDLREVNPVT